jgi:hypothetical protein
VCVPHIGKNKTNLNWKRKNLILNGKGKPNPY